MPTMRRALNVLGRHRAHTAGITAAVLAIAAVIVIITWPSRAATPPVAYTNISRNYKTCLISTTPNTTQATPVWKAIQAATTQAPINAQQLTPPTGTTDQLTPYLNSLIALHCQLIITTGNDLNDALTTTASHNPHTHFLTIGTTTNQPNIHTIPTPLTNPQTITTYILNATHDTY